jgi:hypothetical protein
MMATVEWAKLVLEYLKVLTWPAVLVVAGVVLRRQLVAIGDALAARMHSMTSAKVPGVELQFEARAVRAADSLQQAAEQASSHPLTKPGPPPSDDKSLEDLLGDGYSPTRPEHELSSQQWEEEARSFAWQLKRLGTALLRPPRFDDLFANDGQHVAREAWSRLSRYVETVQQLYGVPVINGEPEYLTLRRMAAAPMGPDAFVAVGATLRQLHRMLITTLADPDANTQDRRQTFVELVEKAVETIYNLTQRTAFAALDGNEDLTPELDGEQTFRVHAPGAC